MPGQRFFVVAADADFWDRQDDLVLADPNTLAQIVERARDWDNPIRIVAAFGDDASSGAIAECACNLARYEHGHMERCPLAGYPPEVIVLDVEAG